MVAGFPSARACIARKSSRWFANVFCDWRILRTFGVCFPCAVLAVSGRDLDTTWTLQDNVPLPLLAGSGMDASLLPSRSKASTSLRIRASCLADKSPMLKPGPFFARRFSADEGSSSRRVATVSGTYAHPGADVVLALASSTTPKLFMLVFLGS